MRNPPAILAVVILAGFLGAWSPLYSEDEIETSDTIDCEINFNFQAWSFFYHYGKGEGTVACSDGQESDVVLRTEGGGIINFGANTIVDGYGKFSPIKTLDEIYGTYAATGGDIGLGDSISGINLSKTKGGRVVINLSGAGEGFEVGFHYSNFSIKPKPASP